jgi:Txe/YoeB family toxin of Txe-Axe toxin-antitoxin module
LKKLIILTMLILIICLTSPTYASNKFFKTTKFFINEIVRNQLKKEKQQREKLKKEVCKLFKEKIKAKKIIYDDLDLISSFIHDQIPFGKWKSPNRYKNKTEQVGYELIDKRLTKKNYEILRDLLNKIWKSFGKYEKNKRRFYFSLPGGGINFAY